MRVGRDPKRKCDGPTKKWPGQLVYSKIKIVLTPKTLLLELVYLGKSWSRLYWAGALMLGHWTNRPKVATLSRVLTWESIALPSNQIWNDLQVRISRVRLIKQWFYRCVWTFGWSDPGCAGSKEANCPSMLNLRCRIVRGKTSCYWWE